MARIVLVHGAWQGAWCWQRVVPLLADGGHDVVTPTLRGSGERCDELSPSVALDDHVDDLVAVIDAGAGPVTLVAHSYSGMAVAGVVARRPGAVASAVYVDAFYPDQGQAAIDQMPAPFRELFRERARTEGDGWRLPATDALLDVWGLHDDDDRRWVGEHLTDWSLTCFESPSDAPRSVLEPLPRWYVGGGADYPARAAFRAVAAEAEADGCTVVTLPTGHDVMIEAPDALASIVLEAAAER